jgi:hypothetical protein
VSPAKLKSDLEAKGTIGMNAELAVVEYEKKRVGSEYASLIDHVSSRDASAGYDIESVTVATSSYMPRYIEVKAVPSTTYRFYWSENEIAMSHVLRDLYYLYLLPISPSGKFELSQLMIICDPPESILLPESEWSIEAYTIRCELSQSPERQ